MAEANSTVIYKDIDGFPGYQVGNDGTVWSLREKRYKRGRIGAVWVLGKNRKPLRGCISKNGGHRSVLLSRDNVRKHFFVHRLVLLAFVGPAPSGCVACHNDGNPKNNNVSNLRWDSPKANTADSIKHGSHVGIHTGKAKLTDEKVREIRARYSSGETSKALATEYNVCQNVIWRVVSRRRWKHVA